VTAQDKRATRVVVLVFFTVFLDLAGFGIIIPLLPLYVKSMSGTAETVGFLFASFSFTQLIAAPILGRLSDRYGRRRVMLVSLAGNAASMVLFALATDTRFLPLLFVSRILAGATAGNISACQAAVADVTQGSDRARAMGRIGAGIGLGMVLGPAIGSFAAAWRPDAPPLAAAALAALDLGAAFFLMPETRVVSGDLKDGTPYRGPQASAQPSLLASTLTVIADPSIARILLLSFLTFLSMTTLQVALPLLAAARLGWGSTEVGRMFTLFGLLGLVVQGLLIGSMTRTFGALNLVVVAMISSVAGLLVIAAAHTAWGLLGGLVFFGFGLSLANPLLSTLATERAGASRQGMVLGVAQSASGLARTIGPVATGVLYARIGPGAAFVGGACAAFVGLIVATIARARSASVPLEIRET
jgi:DHA1 family tetracycline resistance protein-like MFS transporter